MPFPAGSSTDIIARILGQRLSTRLGQQVVIDNRAGASGNIGADAVAKAAPDGYTLGIATASTHALAVSLSANLPYDPIKDFTPVAMIGGQPYVLVIYPGLARAQRFRTDRARQGEARHAQLRLGRRRQPRASCRRAVRQPRGREHHARAVQVLGAVGDRHDHRPARHAVRHHRADACRTSAPINCGRSSTTGAKRSAALPDVPTVAEAALPGYEAVLWVALVMPPATPPAIIARLNREVNDILKSADAKDALVAQGVEPEPGPPEAVTQRIRTDIDKWRGVVAKAGIQAK